MSAPEFLTARMCAASMFGRSRTWLLRQLERAEGEWASFPKRRLLNGTPGWLRSEVLDWLRLLPQEG